MPTPSSISAWWSRHNPRRSRSSARCPCPRRLSGAAAPRAPAEAVTISVPEHDPDSVCGPAKLERHAGVIRDRPVAPGPGHGLYAKGDELVVDGGRLSGLQVGENFVVRRTYRIDWDPRDRNRRAHGRSGSDHHRGRDRRRGGGDLCLRRNTAGRSAGIVQPGTAAGGRAPWAHPTTETPPGSCSRTSATCWARRGG